MYLNDDSLKFLKKWLLPLVLGIGMMHALVEKGFAQSATYISVEELQKPRKELTHPKWISFDLVAKSCAYRYTTLEHGRFKVFKNGWQMVLQIKNTCSQKTFKKVLQTLFSHH